jgi:lipopolysaccharide biosynthesis glycosyltransferase
MLSGMEQNYTIYTAADWGYRFQLAVMLDGINTHCPCDGQAVVVLTEASSAQQYAADFPRFDRLTVEFRVVETSMLSGVPVYGHVGVMTYVRLLMEKVSICPEERVLYLDADILVRRSLAPIFTALQELTEPVAAIREMGTYSVSGRGGVFNWRDLGLPPERVYFNAGVLGLRMDLIRRQSLFTQALNYLVENGRRVLSWDQGALNAVCREVSIWPLGWNCTTSALSYVGNPSGARAESFNLNDVVIAHFTGSGASKPWHVNSISPYASEYRSKFLHYGGVTSCGTRLERYLGVRVGGVLRRARLHLNGTACRLN